MHGTIIQLCGARFCPYESPLGTRPASTMHGVPVIPGLPIPNSVWAWGPSGKLHIAWIECLNLELVIWQPRYTRMTLRRPPVGVVRLHGVQMVSSGGRESDVGLAHPADHVYQNTSRGTNL